MTSDLTASGKRLAKKGIITQLFISSLLLMVTGVFAPSQIVAVLFGAVAFVIPHSVFAYWHFRYAGASKMKLIAQSINQGMKLKFILTVILFVIAFAIYKANALFLIGTYAVIMVSQQLALVYYSQQS